MSQGSKVESGTELQLIRVLLDKLSHIQSRFNSMTFVHPIFILSISVLVSVSKFKTWAVLSSNDRGLDKRGYLVSKLIMLIPARAA